VSITRSKPTGERPVLSMTYMDIRCGSTVGGMAIISPFGQDSDPTDRIEEGRPDSAQEAKIVRRKVESALCHDAAL
jgi:hypothetical protein